MDSSMSYPNLPLDIQLNILDHLIADTDRIKLSKFAAVSKFWQYVVERKLFQSLTVNTFDLKHLAAYPKGRTHFIKHIVLELNLDRYQWILLPSEGCFLKTAQTLFKIISTWDGHDITLELAVLSHEEVYYKYAEERSIYVIPRKPRAQSTFSQYKQYFDLPQEMLFGGLLVDSEASWHYKVSLLLGRRALAFRPSRLEDAQLQVVNCISKLLIRRRYFPNIAATSLARIMDALPCLESVHIERWCYGDEISDAIYDMGIVHSPYLFGHMLITYRVFGFLDSAALLQKYFVL